MNTDELDRLLLQTLADTKLSLAEKKYLHDWVEQHATTEADWANARQRAFAVAQQQLATGDHVLSWLAGVVELFHAKQVGGGQAFFSPGATCIQQLIHELRQVRRQCDICVFTITDNRISDAIESAHRRGIDVRIITDDEKAHDAGSDIWRLARGGIQCKTDRDPAHMHHKFAIFDRKRLVTGSFNWTRSASEMNEENLIVTPDPALVIAFYGRFEKLWAELSFFEE